MYSRTSGAQSPRPPPAPSAHWHPILSLSVLPPPIITWVDGEIRVGQVDGRLEVLRAARGRWLTIA